MYAPIFFTKITRSNRLEKFLVFLSIFKKVLSEFLVKIFSKENHETVFNKNLEFFHSKINVFLVQFLVFKKIANFFKKKKKSQNQLFLNYAKIIIWEPFFLLIYSNHILKTSEIHAFWKWISSDKKENKIIKILNTRKISLTKKQNLDYVNIINFSKNIIKKVSPFYRIPHFLLYSCKFSGLANALNRIKPDYLGNKKWSDYFYENQKNFSKKIIHKYYLSVSKFPDLFSSFRPKSIIHKEISPKIFEEFFLSNCLLKERKKCFEIKTEVKFESGLKHGEVAYQQYLNLKKPVRCEGEKIRFRESKWGFSPKKKVRNSITSFEMSTRQKNNREHLSLKEYTRKEKDRKEEKIFYLTKIFFLLLTKRYIPSYEDPFYKFIRKIAKKNPVKFLFDVQHFCLGYEKYEIKLKFFNKQRDICTSVSGFLFKISKKGSQFIENIFEQTYLILVENIGLIKKLISPFFTIWVLERMFHLSRMYPELIFKNSNQEKKTLLFKKTGKKFFFWNFGEFRIGQKIKIIKRFESIMVSNQISVFLFFQLSKKILTQGVSEFSLELVSYFRFFSFFQLCPIIFMAIKILFKIGTVGKSRFTSVQGVLFLNLFQPPKRKVFWKFWFFSELILGSNSTQNTLNNLRISFSFLTRHCFFQNSYLE